MELPVQVTVSIAGIIPYTRARVELDHRTKILEHRTMSNTPPGEINFQTGLTLPAVYGDYSSHHIQIGLKIPASKEEVDNFEEVVEPYLERAMMYARKATNAVLINLGKKPVFADGEEEE